MTPAVRSAAALRSLYERYRTARALPENRDGEWLVIKPGSSEAEEFCAAFMVLVEDEAAALPVLQWLSGYKKDPGYPLNATLEIRHPLDLLLISRRTRGGALWVRFDLVPRRKRKGDPKRTPTPRKDLPAAGVSANLDLDLNPTPVPAPTFAAPDPVAPPVAPAAAPEAPGSGEDEFVDTEDAHVDETSAKAISAHWRAKDFLKNHTAPIISIDEEEARPWEEVSRLVMKETLEGVRSFRNRGETGRLLVLAPSPGVGKTHAMMLAAVEEQDARRTVGYAVLGREQLPEAEKRLKASGPDVHLIVIRGRDKDNCDYFSDVQAATDAGFPPGSAVCPSCEKYPSSWTHPTCGYYEARRSAAWERDQIKKGRQVWGARIILTTHASAIIGSHIVKGRYQGFWDLDTLFIDEDPLGSMLTQHVITEESLIYERRDSHGNPDGPTVGTAVLREAMEKARRERDEAGERRFKNRLTGVPDKIHNPKYGSSYAGADLQGLLTPIARTYMPNLSSVAAGVIDGMTERPAKGALIGMDARTIAETYPNRHLRPFFQAIEHEMRMAEELKATNKTPGIGEREPAYRAHLDLALDSDGSSVTAMVHEFKGFANGRTNIVIGDAYANIDNYEALFTPRSRANGTASVIRHRALWPVSSKLIRYSVHAGLSDLDTKGYMQWHLDTRVRGVLLLERGRKVLFYTHKKLKTQLLKWLADNREELGLGETAVEHWGGGRGKDIYKDFDTFVGVSEYVPNVVGLLHESNTAASFSLPVQERVAHWSGYAPRNGSMRFVNSIQDANPFYRSAFYRKAVDELAQAIHRIRPAIPSANGNEKRAYVFGCQIPWTDELVAATTAMVIADNGKDEVDLEVEPDAILGRGVRFEIQDALGLRSARETAGAIGTVYRHAGVWSHAFIHALMGVQSWDAIENAIRSQPVGVAFDVLLGMTIREGANDGPHVGVSAQSLKSLPKKMTQCNEPGIAYREGSSGAPASPLVHRVYAAPTSWPTTAAHVSKTSDIYEAGLALFVESLAFKTPRRLRLPWMPQGSRGYEFWGDADNFKQILNDEYAPGVEKVPY